MRIVILGVGHVGLTIAKLLASTGDYEVAVVDQSEDALKGLEETGVRTALRDISARPAMDDVISGCDAVVNALPFRFAPLAALAAFDAGCHYFDLTEDVAATRKIKQLAEVAQTAFVPQCGLAPGFVGIVTRNIIKHFDQVHEVKMRVGALPAFPTNSLKYNITWSVEGLVNEYCHPCEGLREGKIVELMPLEGLESLVIDGVQYEAFNTSGGLGTMCESLAGTVRSLDYKTIRYPGHCSLMRFLLEELRLKLNQDRFVDILRNSVPATPHDLVIIFIEVIGVKRGSLVQDIFTRKIVGGPHLGGSAIQISTASSLCAVVDLFRLGSIPDCGFTRQEDIDFAAFMGNRFSTVYRDASEPYISEREAIRM